MLSVAEYSTFESLGEIAPIWRQLLERTSEATFFQSPEWMECQRHLSGNACRPKVLVVLKGSEPVGLLPLVIEPHRTRLGRLKAVRFAGSEWPGRRGPVGPNPAATLYAALQHLAGSDRTWDMLDLTGIDRDATDRGRTANAFRMSGCTANESHLQTCGTIDLTGDWSSYWGTRSNELRYAAELARGRIQQFGDVRYVRFRPMKSYRRIANANSFPSWDLFHEFEQIASRPMHAETLNPARFGSGNSRFLGELHQAASAAGMLDLNVLFVAGRAAAASWNVCLEGRVEIMRMSLAPGATQDAGVVLIREMLRDSFDRGDRRLVFTPEDTPATTPWQTDLLETYQYRHYAPDRLRAQASRLLQGVRRALGAESRRYSRVQLEQPLPPRKEVLREKPQSSSSLARTPFRVVHDE